MKYLLLFYILLVLTSCSFKGINVSKEKVNPEYLKDIQSRFSISFETFTNYVNDTYFLVPFQLKDYTYVAAIDSNKNFLFIHKYNHSLSLLSVNDNSYTFSLPEGINPFPLFSHSSFKTVNFKGEEISNIDHSDINLDDDNFIIDSHDLIYDDYNQPIEIAYIEQAPDCCTTNLSTNPTRFMSAGIRYKGINYDINYFQPYDDRFLFASAFSSSQFNNLFQFYSFQNPDVPIDYIHINSLFRKGNLVYASARMSSSIYIFDLSSLTYVDVIGGRNSPLSTFTVEGDSFSNQHDVFINSKGNLMMYNNNVGLDFRTSQVLEYEIDYVNRELNLLWEYDMPRGKTGFVTGNINEISEDDYFIFGGSTMGSNDNYIAVRVKDKREVLFLDIKEKDGDSLKALTRPIFRILTINK
tara:strand:- start:2680 stop:3912 length:1233 start_codon:yes stop_codon:yes gene_type:complete